MFNDIIKTYEGTVKELIDSYNDRYAKACEAYKRGDIKNYNKNVSDMNQITDLMNKMNSVMSTLA